MQKLALLAPLILLSTGMMAAPAQATVLPGFVTRPIGRFFEKAAAKKQGRVFHEDGVAYHATIRTSTGVHEGVVRVSRGGANKVDKPDILGLAVKVHEAGGDQDFLLVTALGNKGLANRVPAFRNTLAGQKMSSLTSYRLGARKGAIITMLPAAFHTAIDSAPAIAKGDQSFRLTLQQSRLFRRTTSTTVANDVTVHFDSPLSAEESATLKFTPFNDAAGIKPVGLINALRPAAYVGSQTGRGAR